MGDTDLHSFLAVGFPPLRITLAGLPQGPWSGLQAPEAADEGTRHWVSDGKNVSSAPMPAASSAASWAAVRACSDPSVATRMRFIWNPTSALDADQRREPRHAPSKACMLSRQHDSVDILVGARGFFRDAAR